MRFQGGYKKMKKKGREVLKDGRIEELRHKRKSEESQRVTRSNLRVGYAPIQATKFETKRVKWDKERSCK